MRRAEDAFMGLLQEVTARDITILWEVQPAGRLVPSGPQRISAFSRGPIKNMMQDIPELT